MANKTHPRLKPYHLLTQDEKNKYVIPITDALKTLLALNWRMDGTGDVSGQTRGKSTAGMSVSDYTPQPADLSSLTLGKELLAMSEKVNQSIQVLN